MLACAIASYNALNRLWSNRRTFCFPELLPVFLIYFFVAGISRPAVAYCSEGNWYRLSIGALRWLCRQRRGFAGALLTLRSTCAELNPGTATLRPRGEDFVYFHYVRRKNKSIALPC